MVGSPVRTRPGPEPVPVPVPGAVAGVVAAAVTVAAAVVESPRAGWFIHAATSEFRFGGQLASF